MSAGPVDVKICGVCHPADAEHAAAAGAAYVGVILAPGFARTQSLREAAAIYAATTARRVGVFVDASADDVLRTAERLGLDVAQLHGDEAPELARAVARGGGPTLWKAVRVDAPADLATAGALWRGVIDGIVLEGRSDRGVGGVGARFDWSSAAQVRDALDGVRVILAGGLTPGNVAEAVAALGPDVVDVSSGVEHERGRKSARLVEAFMGAVRQAVARQGSA